MKVYHFDMRAGSCLRSERKGESGAQAQRRGDHTKLKKGNTKCPCDPASWSKVRRLFETSKSTHYYVQNRKFYKSTGRTENNFESGAACVKTNPTNRIIKSCAGLLPVTTAVAYCSFLAQTGATPLTTPPNFNLKSTK